MKKKNFLKIALVAPPFGPIGGPEIVVQNLTDALLEKGVKVTLFAPKDWKTKAKIVPTLKQSLWNMKDFSQQDPRTRRNFIIYSQLKALFHSDGFDIIHLNSQAYAYSVAKLAKIPVVLSFHNRIPRAQYDQLKETKLHMVSLSKFQKGKLKTDATIWNGVPTKKIAFSLKPKSYLIFIGRLDDQKGPDLAIKIAKRAGKKLLIFGRIGLSKKRQEFFEKKLKPYLNKNGIKYMKEAPHRKILDYIRGAEATLLPLRRPEVCPMVVAESLACGTPIIGTLIDPLPELLGKNGKIGLLSNNLADIVCAAKNTSNFDRKECRKYAEKYFDSSLMAEKYIKLYKKIIRDAKK